MLIYIITQLIGILLFNTCATWHFVIGESWREPIDIFSINMIKNDKFPKVLKVIIWLSIIILFHCMFMFYLLLSLLDVIEDKIFKEVKN